MSSKNYSYSQIMCTNNLNQTGILKSYQQNTHSKLKTKIIIVIKLQNWQCTVSKGMRETKNCKGTTTLCAIHPTVYTCTCNTAEHLDQFIVGLFKNCLLFHNPKNNTLSLFNNKIHCTCNLFSQSYNFSSDCMMSRWLSVSLQEESCLAEVWLYNTLTVTCTGKKEDMTVTVPECW